MAITATQVKTLRERTGVGFMECKTALTEAVLDGGTETVKVLIAAGADVNVELEDGETALMIAAVAGDTKIVEILRQAGARQ